jgi:hypothetical protein
MKETVRKGPSANPAPCDHGMKVKDEIERLAREYGKRGEPWVFVAMSTRILVLINPIPAHL